MGGLVFSNPGPRGEPSLKTPRLSPEIYTQLRNKYVEELKKYYASAIALKEVPGKADFGDIDLLVEQPKSSFTADQLAGWLGAARYTVNGRLTSFAVAHPDADGLHAQLDVEVCPEGFIQWETFQNSYGDLWQILGVIIRDIGLTASDKGLHVRIPELEQVSRKGARMFLTTDPTETMQFLGLDAEKYNAGFTSIEDIYTWCAGCRFFNPLFYYDQPMSANDRRRKITRKMYRDFIDVWVPAHPRAGSKHRLWAREDILEDAIQTFNKSTEYDAIMKTQQLAQAEKELWSRIAAIIPFTGDAMSLVMRALKRWTDFSDAKPFIRAFPIVEYQSLPLWVSCFPAEEKECVLEWVQSHWERVRSLEKRRISLGKAAHKRLIDT